MDALEVGEALSRAITTCDLGAVERLYTDATRVWHSHDQVEKDKGATLAYLAAFFKDAAEIRYADVRRVRTEEGYVQQHVFHTLLKSGERFEPRPICIVARIEDGKVLRIDEYLAPRRLIPAQADEQPG